MFLSTYSPSTNSNKFEVSLEELKSLNLIPSLEKLMKEGGETGKQKINKYTKLVSLILALIEALGIYISYSASGISST